MQLKRKKKAYFYVHQNEGIILCTFPRVQVQISPARRGCALLNDWLTSATSPFSPGSLITTSMLAAASGIVPTIHLVQHRGEEQTH